MPSDEPQCETERNEAVTEYGDRLADAAKLMCGEADELAARDDVNDHLQDVIDGLRYRASEIENFLNSEYYIQRGEE